MEDIKEKENIKFSVFCPYLKREVILYKNTWHYKILHDHPEASNRIELITAILSKDEKDTLKYRKKIDSNRIAIFKECPHFLPYNRYIKIGLKIIDEKRAVVTTVHGQRNLPGTDMEEIK
jgi:hypothetical protein